MELNKELQELKITWLNYWLIKIGIKTLELRAYERLGNGGWVTLTSTWGRPLAKIKLEIVLMIARVDSYRISEDDDDFEPELKIGDYGELISNEGNVYKNPFVSYISKTWFWRRWVKHYLDKGLIPAFYQIIEVDYYK